MAETIHWEAAEYVQAEKNRGWYIGLVLIGIATSALAFWMSFWSFGVLIIVSVLALIIYSVRPPRILKYKLTSKGLTEGEKQYKFSDYKSFAIQQNGDNFAIVMIPRKSFGLKTTIYFPREKGEQIVDVFGAKLPMDDVKPDFLDKIIAFLRI